jgi:hypothetical protein
VHLSIGQAHGEDRGSGTGQRLVGDQPGPVRERNDARSFQAFPVTRYRRGEPPVKERRGYQILDVDVGHFPAVDHPCSLRGQPDVDLAYVAYVIGPDVVAGQHLHRRVDRSLGRRPHGILLDRRMHDLELGPELP